MYHSSPEQSNFDGICMDVSQQSEMLICCKVFGQWIFHAGSKENDSDNSWNESSFTAQLKVQNHYWFEWDFEMVVAEEAEMLDEKSKDEEQLERLLQEEAEEEQYWLSLLEDNGPDDMAAKNRAHV